MTGAKGVTHLHDATFRVRWCRKDYTVTLEQRQHGQGVRVRDAEGYDPGTVAREGILELLVLYQHQASGLYLEGEVAS